MYSNSNLDTNIIYTNLKKYTKKMDKDFSKVFQIKSMQKDDILVNLMLSIYGLSNKELKNKLINITNAIQILNIANGIEDKMINDSSTEEKTQGYNSFLLSSEYYYNFVVKIFYENYPQTVGIIQRIVEQRIMGQIIRNKNRFNYKMSIPQYIDILNKKWGIFYELCGLISAYVAKLNKDKTKSIKEFSNTIGVAYGIKKEIDFMEQNIKNGIIILPTIFMVSKTTKFDVSSLKDKKFVEENYNNIIDEIEATGAMREAKKIIQGYLEHALMLINDIDGKQNLRKIIQNYFFEASK